MPSLLNRRGFVTSGGLTVVSLISGIQSQAVEPFVHKGPSRLRLGLAAYSFRDQFKHSGKDVPGAMDMFRFIDFCAEHRCDGAELTSYYFPEAVGDTEILQVRRHAHLRGVTVSGTAVGNDFCLPTGSKRSANIASVKEWIRRAVLLGAPHIRVFAGSLHETSEAEAKRLTIAALEECGEVAAKAGIFLGVENHGGIVHRAESLVEIVRAVQNPWVGINLDSGNFFSEDPYRDLALCAPWAVNVQFKGKIHPAGQKEQKADYPRTFKILRDSGYQGFVTLEYELPENPFIEVPRILEAMRPFMG